MSPVILAMMWRIAMILCVACVSAACSLPLASRRAQVLEPGELEVSGGASGGVLFERAAVGDLSASYVPTVGTNASLRLGLMRRIDLQLRLLDVLVPEVSVGWQLVGDPDVDELALTLTAGVGPVAGAGFSNATGTFTQIGAFVPVQVLMDVPVGDGALTFGARAIASGSRVDVNGDASYRYSLTPGFTASWTLPFADAFFVRPELAGNVPIASEVPLGQGAVVMLALAVGYEFRL